jgi:hypothetical protein
MIFEITHLVFDNKPERFTEKTAPNWLTSCNTRKGSSIDGRAFWYDYVLKLDIGKSIETDYRKITRVN